MLVKYENHSEIFFDTLHLKFEQGISRLGQRFYPQPQPVINILIHVFIYFLCVLCSEHTAYFEFLCKMCIELINKETFFQIRENWTRISTIIGTIGNLYIIISTTHLNAYYNTHPLPK